jgi:ABC-type glutathione transport system ATPase component
MTKKKGILAEVSLSAAGRDESDSPLDKGDLPSVTEKSRRAPENGGPAAPQHPLDRPPIKPHRITSMAQPYLQVANIAVTFRGSDGGHVHAVKDVSFSLKRGKLLGLVGESGSGKSTTARAIMRLVPLAAGHISLGDLLLSSLRGNALRSQRRRFQMVFQDPYASLNPRQTVSECLAEAFRCGGQKFSGDDLSRRVAQLMDEVGLDPRSMRKFPHEFSGGQRQRIAIARALAPDPELIVADEPVSALDVSVQAQILNLLRRLQRERQLTMLFISHDLAVVRYLCDDIAVMRQGLLVEAGPAAQVFSDPQHPYTIDLLNAIPRMPGHHAA